MATTIVTKNSSTASAVPTAGQLVQGELAVNVADKKLYTEDNAGSIIVLADGVKLAGIEALADVTDTANVTAAGALMDSELTSIASVKALDQGVATTDSPSFVGLTASGEITANGGIALGDNDKATFGDGDDLQIYHNGSNSVISDSGTGALYIQATDFLALQSTAGENYARFNANGASAIYHDNVAAIVTTSTGIDVTGTATMDGLTVSGSGTSAIVNISNGIDNTPNRQLAISETGGSGFIYKIDSTGASGLFGQLTLATNGTNRINIGSGGDISFYEDTGTTAKLTWSASNEDLNFTDNVKATFGASDDLQIYHTGSGSYIDDAGTGNLFVRADNFQLRRADGSHLYLAANAGAEVALYHAGNSKLSTTATGIDVTGTATMDRAALYSGVLSEQSQIRFGYSSDYHWSMGRENASTGDLFIESSTTGTDTTRLKIASNGDISFYEDTGTTAKLFWDASAESLGIGTSSPSGNLHVSSSGDTVARITSADGNGAFLDLGDASDPDGGRIVYDSGSNLGFSTASTERMRIDSSGNVGIGTSSPTDALVVEGNVASPHRIKVSNANASGKAALIFTQGTTVKSWLEFDNATGIFDVWQYTNNPLRFGTNNTERMRIDSSGKLLVGGTTENAPGSFTIRPNTSNGSCLVQMNRNSTTDTSNAFVFYNGGAGVGSITYNNTATAYNTSSDERLKENIADANDAGDKIDAIQVRQYDWKADGSHQDYGMIAQELQLVAPEAVSGDADSEEMMGVDYSKLVPMLIKEIQSLRNRVAQLEA
jgi:hypothetical protein